MAYSYCPYCANELGADQVCGHCGQRPEAYKPLPHHFPAGTILDQRYWVGRVLGEGGFGITYLGYDAKLERRLAIKEYFPSHIVHRTSGATEVTCYERDQEEFGRGREQFLTEARALAKLDSIPNIVRVLDYFPANGTAYIVMEFLEGETLKQRLKKTGTMAPGELFDLLDPLMRALEKLHKTGLIHRDISPDNIMILSDEEQVKLMDFGCARNANSGMTMTVMLKPGFAPIEQYSGSEQGPWTDVYALCATLYYSMTGKRLPNAMIRSEDDTLKPPSAYGVKISPAQEEVLMKGLALWRKDRWQSVTELRKALKAAAEGKTPVKQETSPENQNSPSVKKKPELQKTLPEVKKPKAAEKPAPAKKRVRRYIPWRVRLRLIMAVLAVLAVLGLVISAGLLLFGTGWKQLPEGEYTYRVMGFRQKGWKQLDGIYYYFDEEGIMYTEGWLTIEDNTYYFGDDGQMCTGWQKINGKHYYFGDDGRMRTGWQDIDGNRYYFDANGKRRTGWQDIDGNKYFFNASGHMRTGLLEINGNTYYLDADGKRCTGWQTFNGGKYYFGADGKLCTGWQTINGSKYYFDADGKRCTGWQDINGSKYYFGLDGIMCTGWQEIRGLKYYFGDNGKMYTGWQSVDGKWYNFGNNGDLAN